MVIVDTSAWVEFFRNDGKLEVKLAVSGLLEVFESTICGPVEMEILGGARPGERAEILACFDVLPYVRNNQGIWLKAAENYSKVRAAGFTLPWNDILIASIAIEKSVPVYAHDKHFKVMAEHLGLRLYTPGYNGMYNPGC